MPLILSLLLVFCCGPCLGNGLPPTVDFQTLYRTTNASEPRASAVLGSDGHFYGTTNEGGDYDHGTIYQCTTEGVLTILHSFTYPSGNQPVGELVEAGDGAFYGVTEYGGDQSAGVAFKISKDGVFTILHHFSDPEAVHPEGGLILASDGNFYGTTSEGGSFGLGTIFRLTPTGTLTILHSFNGATGSRPAGALLQGGGAGLYGTTTGGGTNNGGTIFKITPGVYTVLHHFTDATGIRPNGSLALAKDGWLYGTTSEGGTGYGTIFKISMGGFYQVSHYFDYSSGSQPYGGLRLGSDGAYYGTTTSGGGNGSGTVYRITTGNVFTLLHAFSNYEDGSGPMGTLSPGTGGNLLGITTSGSRGGSGTIFEITTAGSLATICDFDEPTEIHLPQTLIQGGDGAFYGISSLGGDHGFGTVFKMSAEGEITILHSFGTGEGSSVAGLVLGGDGAFYGTTSGGGSTFDGTIFKITTAGVFTLLQEFNGTNGSSPETALARGDDGAFYGTTDWGGETGNGTIFKVTGEGVLTVLHHFGYDDSGTKSPLAAGGDGAMYGTTEWGGSNTSGGVFKITPDGVFSFLHLFSWDVGGSFPVAGLVRGSDDAFYGTTTSGGLDGYGTVYKITKGGGYTVLHDFDYSEGSVSAALIQGSDGAFYGVNSGHGGSSYGSIFKMTPQGSVTILRDLQAADGRGSAAALVQGRDGSFYGSATDGASTHKSTLFKLTVSPMPAPTHTISVAASLAFGNVGQGGSGQQMLLVTNTGNSPVTVTGILCPEGFASTWAGIIPAGIAQPVPVTFSPASIASYSGTLTVQSDATGGNTCEVSGSGITPVRVVSLSGDLAFGSVVVGSSPQKTLTISNSGNAPLTVDGIQCPAGFACDWSGIIPADGSKAVTVTFAPEAAQNYSGSLAVHSNATSGTSTIPVSGSGILATRIISLGGEFSFGEVVEGFESRKNLTISNTGNAPLTVSGISCPDGYFADWTGTIQPGESQEVTVTFAPSEAHPYSGTLSVFSNATSGSGDLPVSGIGIAAIREITLGGDLAFGSVPVGTAAHKTLTISNTGNTPLNVYYIDFPTGFSGYFYGEILPGITEEIDIEFTPTANQKYSGTIAVSSDATGGTNTRAISGKGVAATRIIALKGNLAFGEVRIGTSAQRKLTISNTGNSPLTVTGIDYPKGFSGNWTGTIPAGGSQIVGVTFTPTRKKTYSGNLTVLSDKTSGTNTKAVSGTGK